MASHHIGIIGFSTSILGLAVSSLPGLILWIQAFSLTMTGLVAMSTLVIMWINFFKKKK